MRNGKGYGYGMKVTERNVSIRVKMTDLWNIIGLVHNHQRRCMDGKIDMLEWDKEGIVLSGKQVVFK